MFQVLRNHIYTVSGFKNMVKTVMREKYAVSILRGSGKSKITNLSYKFKYTGTLSDNYITAKGSVAEKKQFVFHKKTFH